MKRVFFVVVVFFAMASAHAQEKGLHLILGGELGQTNFIYDLKDGSSKGGLGFGGYLGAQYFFNRHWGISLAGEFFQFNTHSRYNQSFPFEKQVDNEGDEYTLRIHLENSKEYQKTNFVEIPVMLVFQHKYGKKERCGVYFGLGVKPQILISSSFSVEGARATAFYPKWELPFEPGLSVDIPWHGYGNNPDRQWEGDNSLKFGLAAVGEFGFLFGLSRRVDLTLGASVDYGFLNINKTNDMLLYPTGIQQDGKFVAEMIDYNGLLNSDKIDRINPMSIRGKVGLRVKIGKLKERPAEPESKKDESPSERTTRVIMDDTIFVSPIVVYLSPQVPEGGEPDGTNKGGTTGDGTTYTSPINTPLPQEVEDTLIESIYFDLDKSFLRPESKEVLDRKVALMKKYPQAVLGVFGYTCNLGSEGHNDKLSADRAEAARKYIIEKGINPARIIPIPKGMHDPKYENISETNRELNRRVDFVIMR